MTQPLRPNSRPLHCGLDSNFRAIHLSEKDITEALDSCDLERAKTCIYHVYGLQSEKTCAGLLKIVEKIVQLNAEALSEEHQKLGYNLENAYSLGCDVYTIATNTTNVQFYSNRQKTCMDIAKKALVLIANAYVEKGLHVKAEHCLNRLDKKDAEVEKKKLFKASSAVQEEEKREFSL